MRGRGSWCRASGALPSLPLAGRVAPSEAQGREGVAATGAVSFRDPLPGRCAADPPRKGEGWRFAPQA